MGLAEHEPSDFEHGSIVGSQRPEPLMNVNFEPIIRGLKSDGYPAYSHHDRFPPWWVFVRDDYGGNLSGDKFPP